MTRTWNCLDDSGSVTTAIESRILTATIASFEPLGAGVTKLLIELRDTKLRPYQYVAADEAIITVFISDDTTGEPSNHQVCGSTVINCLAHHGIGTAQGDYIAQNWTFELLIQQTDTPPSIAYVSLHGGVGSTYIIRPARRAWTVLLAA